jgi:hypothetical protein
MNLTIIIILVVLILLVAGAIVFTLVKGKKDDSSADTSAVSPMTFQEQGTPAVEVPQEPDVFTPQLQTQTPTEAPVMQDLSTPPINQPQVAPVVEEIPAVPQNLDQPMNAPVMQAQEVPMQPVDVGVTQSPDLYQQATVMPDATQMTQDMSQFNQQVQQSAPDSNVMQPNVPSEDQIDGDMQNIMDALSTPLEEAPAPTPMETPVTSTMPEFSNVPAPSTDISTPDVIEHPMDTVGVPTPQIEQVPDMNTMPPMDTPVAPISDVNSVTPQPMDNTQTPPVPPMGI